MELKGRLKAIADSIPKCDILSDIGTDHAYIPAYAVKNSICKRAIAADVKKGPVKIAIDNIARYGFEETIDVRLGYGLEPIDIYECEVIVIAGMGGMLIREILESSRDKAEKAELFVLQPMNCIEFLRKWLFNNGFEIIDESLVEEQEKIYIIICAKWTGNIKQIDDFACYIGTDLLQKDQDLFKKYALKKLAMLERKINGIKMAERDKNKLNELTMTRDKLLKLVK